jgi:FKBP-type peptidyl-prolyl cis-trans isomerase
VRRGLGYLVLLAVIVTTVAWGACGPGASGGGTSADRFDTGPTAKPNAATKAARQTAKAEATPGVSTTKVTKKNQTATAQAQASAGIEPTATPTIAPVGPITLENPQVLPNGVQVQEIKAGSGGEALNSTSIAVVRYVGRLAADGKVFDQTPEGKTSTFSMSNVIAGFSTGLAGMRVGGQRRILIPAAQAYGAQGRPPLIPPNADLVFDVELVSLR